MALKKPEDINSLPQEIPIFPLSGVLLLPSGQLPLNIFEDRYITMIEDALKAERLIGMIQPKDKDTLFDVGCAGRISAFEETNEGYLITLTGLCRFKIEKELALHNGYRRIIANWEIFKTDMKTESCLDLDRDQLKELLGNYFDLHEISCDWNAVDGAPDQKLITCLSMICPFDASEKQALLEAACCHTRAKMFVTMLEMAVQDKGCCGGCH